MTVTREQRLAPSDQPPRPGQNVASQPRFVRVPAGINGDVVVLQGSRLLAGVLDRPGIAGHRARWHRPAPRTAKDLIEITRSTRVSGRGGAGFPLHRKLSAAAQAGQTPIVVINAAEGEPGSAKDSALILTAAHLVMDGATIAAEALGANEIHLIVPGERPAVVAAAFAAAAEHDHSLSITVTETDGGFVGGQSSAVLELLAGRKNLPVTTWEPATTSGLRGRPTLLSNAETYAQLAVLNAVGPEAYGRVGTPDQPGTLLVTIAGDGPHGVVLEVPYGAKLFDVLTHLGHDTSSPVVIGGYHGAWLTPQDVATRRLSTADLAEAGADVGAGVILPVPRTACPVHLTWQVVEYLAEQSARRCGPCRNGLPALAEALGTLTAGHAGETTFARVEELIGLVPGRGACAHPDGTVRLVRSLLRCFPEEVAVHLGDQCRYHADTRPHSSPAAAPPPAPMAPPPAPMTPPPVPMTPPPPAAAPPAPPAAAPPAPTTGFEPPPDWRTSTAPGSQS